MALLLFATMGIGLTIANAQLIAWSLTVHPSRILRKRQNLSQSLFCIHKLCYQTLSGHGNFSRN